MVDPNKVFDFDTVVPLEERIEAMNGEDPTLDQYSDLHEYCSELESFALEVAMEKVEGE